MSNRLTLKRAVTMIICCAFICTVCVACDRSDTQKNVPNAYSEAEVKALFVEHKDMFLKLPKILEIEGFWENGRSHETATSASLTYPLDKTDALYVFSNEDEEVIVEFFETLKPYMVSVRYQEYLEVSFINEDRTSAYHIFYQYGRTTGDRYPLKTPETNIFKEANEKGRVYADLKQNGWGFYYSTGYDTEDTYSQISGSDVSTTSK